MACFNQDQGASAYSVSGFIVDGVDEAQALAAVREAVFECLYLDGNSNTLLGQSESLVKQMADFFIMWGPDALTGAFVELSDSASKRNLYEMEGQAPTVNDDKVLAWINREEFSANALKHMISFITAAGELTTDEAHQMKVQMRLE